MKGAGMTGKPNVLDNVNLLIVDDDGNMRQTLGDILGEEGYCIRGAANVAVARAELKRRCYNIVLIDLKLSDGSGLELLKEIKGKNQETAVIIITGYASLDSSISALNEGAFCYIRKPLNPEELKLALKRALKMQKLSSDNRGLLEKLKSLSLTDSHTGLYNHRYLMERLAKEIARARRYIFPLSILMLDIDYFKSINDIYGHQYGDSILKEFGMFLTLMARENDIVVRYGGEEFVILLPDTNKEGAILFGHRLLERISRHVFDPQGKKLMLKVSIGQSGFPEDGIDTADGLVNAADNALQNAKKLGRNRLSTSKKLIEKDIENIIKKRKEGKIKQIKEKISRIAERADKPVLESIHAFAKAIKARDHYTVEHVKAMVSLVTELGRKMKLPPEKIKDLEHAAILHDLGKVGISDKILHKRSRLTKGEYEKIKKHPEIGGDIVKPIRSLDGVIPMILFHHERYDGLGYSSGLKGERIPIGARIVAIADAYQALISDRPYRKAYGQKEAIEIIKSGSGSQFDPQVVRAFLKIAGGKKI